MIGKTLDNTYHGNPGERRLLPKGLIVRLQPATNLPDSSDIKYWVSPVRGSMHKWPKETRQWSETVGLGLNDSDIEIIK